MSLERVIVTNATDLDMVECMSRVAKGGRISNGGYCYVTTCPDGIVIIATLNAASDTFRVIRE